MRKSIIFLLCIFIYLLSITNSYKHLYTFVCGICVKVTTKFYSIPMTQIVEYLKNILPIIAIGISFYSLVVSKKNFKRQIRIAKLEEMLECFYYLCTFYSHFRILIEDLKEINNDKLSKEILQEKNNHYKKRVDYLNEKEVFEKIIIKSNRIGLLSNSYLPNGNLKLKINSTSRFISTMAESIRSNDLCALDSFSTQLPSRTKFASLIEKIEKDIIETMNLGYKSQKWEDLNNYYKKQFKIDLGIE